MQARGLGIAEHIRFTGARIDVPRLLTASDLYVSASLWEGLSVAVLEGMAAGLPVVATAVGESPRMITPEIGRVVEPKDVDGLANAMLEYLCDPELGRSTGERARVFIRENYNPERWFENFTALYTDVIAQSKRK
jgi:glycosyltransferase involved in cell wall biosynthesis